MQTLDEHTFLSRRREPLLSYAIYLESKHGIEEGIGMVAAGLSQPAEVLRAIAPENFMTATRQRAWDGIDLLSLAYSAGHTTADLRALYPRYWNTGTSLPAMTGLLTCRPAPRNRDFPTSPCLVTATSRSTG